MELERERVNEALDLFDEPAPFAFHKLAAVTGAISLTSHWLPLHDRAWGSGLDNSAATNPVAYARNGAAVNFGAACATDDGTGSMNGATVLMANENDGFHFRLLGLMAKPRTPV